MNVSVHHVKPESEQQTLDSMRRFGEAARSAGAVEARSLRDQRSGALLGLAVWESQDAYEAAVPALMQAVEGDDFDAWHDAPSQSYHCLEA